MTEQEELAIFREIEGKAWCQIELTSASGNFWAVRHGFSDYASYRMYTDIGYRERSFAASKKLTECIFLARQKLQREAEDAVSPNERRYKRALVEICNLYAESQMANEIARKALGGGE